MTGSTRSIAQLHITLDDAIDLVTVVGRGALKAKADIESAFRLLPMHPESFSLLCFQFEGQIYYGKCLQMGCAISCTYFEMLSTFLE